MNVQRTVRREISCRSIGLHSGRKVGMTIRPADRNEGIVFVRRDVNGKNRIKAQWDNVSDTTLATTIGNNGTAVSTIEHLMSALCGMGVDNAVIEVDAPEIPIMDGSALPFVHLLKEAGTVAQGNGKKALVVNREVSVSDPSGTASLLPAAEFKITYKIDFPHPLIGQQSYEMVFSDALYEKEIAPARTFGFLKDVEYLQAKGLALGGSLKNAVVLDEKTIINKEGLRFHDEFVKHKILDAIGDLSLLGMPIVGHFVACKSGHRLNNRLLRELLGKNENWTIVDNPDQTGGSRRKSSLKSQGFRILDAIRAI